MTTIDITAAVIRDTSQDLHWTKRYVDWLVENVGKRVEFDHGTAMDQGAGWKLYQRVGWTGKGLYQYVLVDIDDQKLANIFAMRWL